MTNKVILEVAVNGQTPTTRNPNTPKQPQEIAAQAIECLRAGASIIHSHTSDPFVAPGVAAASYAQHYREILDKVPGALLYPTVCVGSGPEARVAHVALLDREFDLRVGLLEAGSLNLGYSGADGMPVRDDFVYVNSTADGLDMVEQCRRLRLGPSVSVFEPGFLRFALAIWRAGKMPPGAMIKLYFGGPFGYSGGGSAGYNFGLPPEPWALDVYLRLLDDCPIPWCVGVLGGDVFENGFAEYAVTRGGHLRVGLEDYAGDRQPRNLDLVQQAHDLCARLGRSLADGESTARMLQLPKQPRPVETGVTA